MFEILGIPWPYITAAVGVGMAVTAFMVGKKKYQCQMCRRKDSSVIICETCNKYYCPKCRKISKCDKCDEVLCTSCKNKHDCTGNEDTLSEEEEIVNNNGEGDDTMGEKIECTNCGNEFDESKMVECSNCSNQFCKDCSQHCEECDSDFCTECYEDDTNHECDIGFQVIIGYKNCNDETTFNFTNKQKAKDTYTMLMTTWKNGTEKIVEYNDTGILIEQIKTIDLRL